MSKRRSYKNLCVDINCIIPKLFNHYAIGTNVNTFIKQSTSFLPFNLNGFESNPSLIKPRRHPWVYLPQYMKKFTNQTHLAKEKIIKAKKTSSVETRKIITGKLGLVQIQELRGVKYNSVTSKKSPNVYKTCSK